MAAAADETKKPEVAPFLDTIHNEKHRKQVYEGLYEKGQYYNVSKGTGLTSKGIKASANKRNYLFFYDEDLRIAGDFDMIQRYISNANEIMESEKGRESNSNLNYKPMIEKIRGAYGDRRYISRDNLEQQNIKEYIEGQILESERIGQEERAISLALLDSMIAAKPTRVPKDKKIGGRSKIVSSYNKLINQEVSRDSPDYQFMNITNIDDTGKGFSSTKFSKIPGGSFYSSLLPFYIKKDKDGLWRRKIERFSAIIDVDVDENELVEVPSKRVPPGSRPGSGGPRSRADPGGDALDKIVSARPASRPTAAAPPPPPKKTVLLPTTKLPTKRPGP
jgi:hypothetical protein